MSGLKRYRATRYSDEIKEIEILRETDKFVVVEDTFWGKKERREAKDSDWSVIRETKEECRQWLVKIYEGELRSAEIRLERAKAQLERAKAL